MRLILAGGGTGGHLFPGIAIAQEALRRDPKSKILFIGSPGGLDSKIVPENNLTLSVIPIGGLKRVGIWQTIKTLVQLPFAILKSFFLVRQFKPDAVIGLGGYSSGPVLIAARVFGYKTGIIENNSIAGFTNKILGKFVNYIFIAFDGVKKSFPAKKIINSGNPVRGSFAPSPLPPPTQFTIGILGGSQGARRLNQVLVEALPQIPPGVNIIHQTGRSDLDWVRKSYADAGHKGEVFDFISDMPSFYKKSTLVICRAGATTISELAASQRPAIFIPFPFAADNHQLTNAKEIEAIGGGKVVLQSDLTAQKLISIVNYYRTRIHELEVMAQNISNWHKSDATTKIIDTFQ